LVATRRLAIPHPQGIPKAVVAYSLKEVSKMTDKSAQKFLGHSDIEVTLEIYTHLSKFKEEKAIQALDEHLKERKKEPEIRLLRAL
jgi:integrase